MASAGETPLAIKLFIAAWNAGEAAAGELVAKEPLASEAAGLLSAWAAAALSAAALEARCTASAGEAPWASAAFRAV